MVKSIRRSRYKSKYKFDFKESSKSELIKKSCENFKKPIYLLRHLHTNSNLVTDNHLFTKFKQFKAKSKGGGLSDYLPYIPIPGVEPNITYRGRRDVKKTARKFKISKTKDNYYTVIVSPLLRTWISALLFIRGLVKNKPFKLKLIISPIIEKPSSGYATKPSINSYNKFKKELNDGEYVTFKFCDNIDRVNYTCDLKKVTDKLTDKKHISLKDMYSKFDGKHKYYKAFSKGGMRIDETVYMISNSCKGEFKNMKDIIVYSHGGVLRGYLEYLGIPEKQCMNLKRINGYAIKFNHKNNKLLMNVLLP